MRLLSLLSTWPKTGRSDINSSVGVIASLLHRSSVWNVFSSYLIVSDISRCVILWELKYLLVLVYDGQTVTLMSNYIH